MTADTVLLVLILVVLIIACVGMGNLRLDLLQLEEKLEKIYQAQMNPRTRVTKAEVHTGMPDELKDLKQLGRASSARRTVVGGEVDSQLYRDLSSEGAEDD